jgi:hypothetical protein
MIERFGEGEEKGIRISVVVESFRVLFLWSVFATLATGVFLTKTFTEIDHTAIIMDVFGAPNICSYLDFPPSNYILPFLWLFPMLFGILYSVVSMFRIWIACEEERITALEKILLYMSILFLV